MNHRPAYSVALMCRVFRVLFPAEVSSPHSRHFCLLVPGGFPGAMVVPSTWQDLGEYLPEEQVIGTTA